MATRVYILGSGSSKGHSQGIFPSIRDFLSCGSEFGLLQDTNYEELGSYVEKLLGQNILKGQTDVDIEALMTHVEIDLERSTSPDLLKIRRDLLNLIRTHCCPK